MMFCEQKNLLKVCLRKGNLAVFDGHYLDVLSFKKWREEE